MNEKGNDHHNVLLVPEDPILVPGKRTAVYAKGKSAGLLYHFKYGCYGATLELTLGFAESKGMEACPYCRGVSLFVLLHFHRTIFIFCPTMLDTSD